VNADAWKEEAEREALNTTSSNAVGVAETGEWEADKESEERATSMAVTWKEEPGRESSNTTFSNAVVGAKADGWEMDKRSEEEIEATETPTSSVEKADAWEMEMERETSKKSPSLAVEAKAGDSNEGKESQVTEASSAPFAVESLPPVGLSKVVTDAEEKRANWVASSQETVTDAREKRATFAASLSSYKIEEKAVEKRGASVASVPSYKIKERAPVFSWSAVLSRPRKLDKEPNAPIPQQPEEGKLDIPTPMNASTPTAFHQLHSVWQNWVEWSEHNKRLKAAKVAAKKKPSFGWLDFFVEVQTLNTTNTVP
jgi:hypothetical protein